MDFDGFFDDFLLIPLFDKALSMNLGKILPAGRFNQLLSVEGVGCSDEPSAFDSEGSLVGNLLIS